MTSIADLLGDLDIDETLLERITQVQLNESEFRKLMQEQPNLVVLSESIRYLRMFDPEAEQSPREFKAFVNLLKLLLIEFARSPYWNSRLGWLMWFWSCYARRDSYFPLKWCFHYDPLNWYRHDEPLRPPELEQVLAEDPYNVKGECFVHPEWYKGKTKTTPEPEKG